MIFVRGDTHGDLSAVTALRAHLSTGDKLIITGDFGFVFRGERENIAERNNLNSLAALPFEILFVDGNHENFPELERYPEVLRYGAPVRQLRPNIFWLRRGYVYTIEAKTFFVMGGGYSLDKALRLEHERRWREKVWFEEEMPSDAEYRRAADNLRQHNLAVDYVLTHTAPRLIIPRVINRNPDPHEEPLNKFLDWVYCDVAFRKWYFGHLHMDMELYDLMVACFETVHRLE